MVMEPTLENLKQNIERMFFQFFVIIEDYFKNNFINVENDSEYNYTNVSYF